MRIFTREEFELIDSSDENGLKNFIEIPEIAPTYIERIVQAHKQVEEVKRRLDSVEVKTAEFNSRRAAAAEKVKAGKENAEEAQKALQMLILYNRDANESAIKSARIEFNNSLSVLKEFHRELEKLDSVERIDLEKEAHSVKETYAQAQTQLWKAVNEAEMIRFAEIARQIVCRLQISTVKTHKSGSPPVPLERFVNDLLAGYCEWMNPEDILHEYLETCYIL